MPSPALACIKGTIRRRQNGKGGEDVVDPTNNVAERALRIAVQWRKIMFGTRSDAGEPTVARLLTVTRTCQMQLRNAVLYLTVAIRCHRRGQTVASLLPKRP